MKKILPLMLFLTTVLFTACQKDTPDEPEAISITHVLIGESAHIIVGQAITLNPTIIPSDATDKTITFRSTDKDVASVNAEGVVTGLKTGRTTIILTSVNETATGKCEITVNEKYAFPLTEYSILEETVSCFISGTVRLTESFVPANATNRSVIWKSSDETIVDVSYGSIMGMSEGKATITATTVDGNITDKCVVTVISNAPADTGDFYYDDGTFSSKVNPDKTCIGIVYIDYSAPEDKRRMIISLDEANVIWGTENVTTHVEDMNDGRVNMAKIKEIPGWDNTYPAFKWCDDKAKKSGKKWHLPASEELSTIAMNLYEINNAIARYDQSAPLIDKALYWSSTENVYTPQQALALEYSLGFTFPYEKNDPNGYVRAVLVF